MRRAHLHSFQLNTCTPENNRRRDADRRCIGHCPDKSGDIVADCNYGHNESAGERPLSKLELYASFAADPVHFTFNIVPTQKVARQPGIRNLHRDSSVTPKARIMHFVD